MRLPVLHFAAVSLPVQLFIAAPLAAQSVIGAPEPSARCANVSTLARSAVGTVLGAWVGFVAVKIKQSDWNDASRSASAHRTRNLATVGGALLGFSIGNFGFRGMRCSSDEMGVRGGRDRTSQRPITLDEIQHAGISGSAYDLVYRLRRTWLNVRGVSLSEGPRVFTDEDSNEVQLSGEPQIVIYLDNARLGTISQLKTLSTVGILGVKYYDPSEATLRWGPGHVQGAIQVLTVPESRD